MTSSIWPWVSSPAQPRWEPESLEDAEVVVEGGFELLAADAGVALLDLG